MTDRELEDFIKFGEENIVQNGYMVGGGWAKYAIQIAKELQERLSQPKLVGFTEYEAEEISKGRATILAVPELLESAGWTRKREWVGLTKAEFDEAVDGKEDLVDCWTAIEAKLKDKNT